MPKLLADLLVAPEPPATPKPPKKGKAAKVAEKAPAEPQGAPEASAEPEGGRQASAPASQPYGTFDACSDCGAGVGEACAADCPKVAETEAAGRPPTADDGDDLSPAMIALATGKAKPVKA